MRRPAEGARRARGALKMTPEPNRTGGDRARPPERGRPGGKTVLAALVVVVALGACGCGRKAKPEPLWSATRLSVITDQSR